MQQHFLQDLRPQLYRSTNAAVAAYTPPGGRRVSQYVLADWCTRWEAVSYPALSYLVGRDWCWAGRADEVPPELLALLKGRLTALEAMEAADAALQRP